MPGGRGGRRTPSSPAAVSGPGALSQRTDGGPAAAQPVRVASGGGYGDRQTLEGLQAAAPMRAGGPSVPAPGGGPQAVPFAGAPDPFGPSQRPWQPATAGAGLGPGGGPQPQADARALLAQLYEVTGDDELLDMIEELDDRAPR